MSPAAATPTPTPILAPVDRPLVPVPVPGAAGFAGFGVAGFGDAGPVCGDESEVVVSDVVVAETNRLLSEACSSIWIGCAHMVTGPLTCVLSWLTCRTVTMVDDELGNSLTHPPYVVVESLGSSI